MKTYMIDGEECYECDGSVVSKKDYPGLYEILKPNFLLSNGDVVLPDLNPRNVPNANPYFINKEGYIF